MCSFHMLPKVGSNVTVLIAKVNLHPDHVFVEFGGSISHGQMTKEIYQQMKIQLGIQNGRDCDFEGNPGDVCLVKEDKTFHRARILSRCGNKYNVFLIDDGKTLWVSNSTLVRCQSSFFRLPPMMELFIMASVSPLSLENRWSPTASEFLRSLSGKTVCACVQDVMMPYRIIFLDIPSVFKQMNEFGFARKIPSENFKTLVVDSLHSPRDDVFCTWPASSFTNVPTGNASNLEKFQQYLCPELLPGTIETVEVTQVVDPMNIFCKLHVFSIELKKLTMQIKEYYESTTVMLRPLYNGFPCATRGSNGKWYRSVLQQNVVTDVAKVFHVDYGTTDFVKVQDIRPLSENFFRLPVVTYACSLYGIIDRGTGWTTGQIDCLKSILLNKIFVGKFENQSLFGSTYYVTLYGNDNVNINNSFAVQEKCLFKSEIGCFDYPFEMSQETHKDFHEYRYETPVHSLESCAFSHPSMSPENEKVTIRPELSTAEVSCAKKLYRRLQTDLSYQHKVESVLDEHLFTVGCVIDVNVSYVESDQKFWCQMAGSVSSLKILMADIQRHYTDSLFQLPTGSICVACHPASGMWYRAQILNQHLTLHVDVRLIDYGQLLRVPVQDLRPIAPEFLKLKRQAFQCSSKNRINSICSESTSFNDSALPDNFEFISSASFCNALLKCTVRAVMYDSQGAVLNVVDVESQDLSTMPVQKEMNSLTVEHLATYSVTKDTLAMSTHNIKVGAEEEVWITCVKSVNHFYGQLKQNAAVVENLTKDLQQFCSKAQQTRYSFSPQAMCLARYSDGQWHRGQIKSVNPKITVHFVDYGDVLALDSSDILLFPSQHTGIMSVPFQAVQFKLFNVTLEESYELNSWFESYATDCTFTATVMAKSPGTLSVELHDGKTNVNFKVKEKWKGIQEKKQNSKTEANMLPKHIEPWRRDNANSRCHAQNCRSGEKSADQSRFPKEKVEKVQCADSKVCANGLLNSQNVEKQMDQHKNEVSTLKDLPSKMIKAGVALEVYLSHCNSPSSFFVQLASEENDVCSLVDKLNSPQLCESQIDFNQLRPGDLVKAQYPLDGAWYRAVVRNKLEDCTIQVEFIDFGNEAKLSVLKVKRLDLQFLKFPRYSIHCSLFIGNEDSKKGTKEQTEKMKNAITNGEKLLCNFIKECASVWQVNIEGQGIMLAESILGRECNLATSLANPCNSLTVCSKDVCAAMYKKPEVSLGQQIQAYASSIAGPNYFWCQVADSEKLDQISMIAQETGNSAQTKLIKLDHLSPGDPCLALFPDDNMWYRAQIITKSENSISVLFVDYGNESEICQTFVKEIPAILLEAPPQAFLCQLEGFKPTDGYWVDDAAGKFSTVLVDKLLKVIIKNVEMTSEFPNYPQYHVQIECNMVLINDLMKEFWNDSTPEVCEQITDEVFQKPMTDLETTSSLSVKSKWDSLCGSDSSTQCIPKISDLPSVGIEQEVISEVYVSHINGPSSFFVQLEKDENCLISVTEKLNSACSVNEEVQINSVSHGSLVKAVFPDDQSWYRAAVIDTKLKDNLQVEFIDFGNEAIVPAMNVCKLDEQFLQFPRFSIHCCLKAEDLVRMQKENEQETCPLRRVVEKAGEKRLFCKFTKESKKVWEVKIANQRSTLDDSLDSISLEKWDDLDFGQLQNAFPKQTLSLSLMSTCTFSSPFKKPEVSIGQTIEVYVSSVVGPNYFWCQHANSEELDKISLIAQEIGNSVQTDPLEVAQLCPSDPCLALFTDKLWYRAQIIRKSSNSMSVLFVDFGNEFETKADSVKTLPLCLLGSPLKAFLCQLEGFNLLDGSWNDDASDKFYELIVDKPLKVTVKNIQNDLDSPSPSYHVNVQCKECSVNEQMKCCWSVSVASVKPLVNTNCVPFLSNGMSASENRVNVISDSSLKITRTQGIQPQCASLLGNDENGENDYLHEEIDKREIKVKQGYTTGTDLDSVSCDSCLTMKYVSESKKDCSGIDGKSSHIGSQIVQLGEQFPHPETAFSNGPDLARQQNPDVQFAPADGVGCIATVEELFQ